ncbi:cation diffusion facilitator family transporter [Pseudooceanicola sp. LIPI14-2-Ac024]|uniref:cation diffusion facilitator family transporter n=1 Tax=Pseudooceanicola sp. LIPI14-2-Ac024 TaxID=3344875 RepID=UPI0035CF8C5D
MSNTLKIAIGSLFVGCLVLALKAWSWWITGSVALLSDALESTVNVATAIAALVAIRVAERPADDTHNYGHHKAEFFSAVLEGVLIVVAAILILREAWSGFQDPRPILAPGPGLALNLLATAINGWWCWVLITSGRRERSPALVADGKHLLADVVTSGGVAFGIVLALATGWWILDPAMAALVAVNILWSGIRVIRESLSGLMDEAVPEKTLARVRDVIAAEGHGAVEAHDLRTRHAGKATFIDFHLVVPGTTSVFEAHEICDRIEAALHAAIPGSRIAIHVEPEHKAKPAEAILVEGDPGQA